MYLKIEEIGGRILKDYSETFHVNYLQKNVTRLLDTLQIQINQEHNIDIKKRLLYTKDGPLRNLSSFNGADVYSSLQTVI